MGIRFYAVLVANIYSFLAKITSIFFFWVYTQKGIPENGVSG